MVYLAILASIELTHSEGIPPQVPSKFVLVPVQANGLCFWSCMWLYFRATVKEILGWYFRSRNTGGFPSPSESDMERRCVRTWAQDLFQMPDECKHRVLHELSAEDEDIDPRPMIYFNYITLYYCTSYCSSFYIGSQARKYISGSMLASHYCMPLRNGLQSTSKWRLQWPQVRFLQANCQPKSSTRMNLNHRALRYGFLIMWVSTARSMLRNTSLWCPRWGPLATTNTVGTVFLGDHQLKYLL